MKHRLINADCIEALKTLECDVCFADPPDNIGLAYNEFKDKKPDSEYIRWLEEFLNLAIRKSRNALWLSFNAKHTFAVGRIFENLVYQFAASPRRLLAKPFVQHFTFGQNCKTDCGNGHRPLWRLMWHDAPLYPNQIKVPSWRELNGDKRAAKGGCVPLDAWDFPRVTGNSKQRRAWHVTQLNEGLVKRAILLTTKEGDHVLDPFGGTGTTLRVCKAINRKCTLVEMDRLYCEKISQEHKDVKSSEI